MEICPQSTITREIIIAQTCGRSLNLPCYAFFLLRKLPTDVFIYRHNCIYEFSWFLSNVANSIENKNYFKITIYLAVFLNMYALYCTAV